MDNTWLIELQNQLADVWPHVIIRFNLEADYPLPSTNKEMEQIVADGFEQNPSLMVCGHEVMVARSIMVMIDEAQA